MCVYVSARACVCVRVRACVCVFVYRSDSSAVAAARLMDMEVASVLLTLSLEWVGG